MGPTASGKTDLAMALADHPLLPECHLISVDSAQVYCGMNIGTGKPSPTQLSHYPHALIDIRDPAQPYSAENFRHDATIEITAAVKARKLPVLVGGTMLYFKALRNGLTDLPSADPVLRAEIVKLAEASGWEAVHLRLKKVDPEAAARIHPNDPQRLQRALEVYLVTGITLSEHHRREQNQTDAGLKELPCRLVWFAIQPSARAELHARIASRFHRMLDSGLIEEVRALYQRDDLDPLLPSIKSTGYRQVWQFLAGELDYELMVERSIIATRQLAKRQLTWLRNWPDLQNLCDTPANSIEHILNFVDSSAI
ncbi:MAG: tRNA (adenosine(37)-N6)-dimethylallyltransferase MiaA [Gammaproteobacteria bacterium]|nr:tRNA (adenosine(37)-N6)-dimethylallyltransferase MiaA [Gammaproteobacteria bacterium]MCY4358482.1 tRNA (adenosine(37)-N6)-dimethylallyltransferase MiaA [Gammaproteobacteria bacterium]